MRRIRRPSLGRTAEYLHPRRDLPIEGQVLLLVTLALTVFGQVMVYSASGPLGLTSERYGNDEFYFAKSGVVYTALGVVLLVAAMRLRPTWLRRLAPLMLVVSLAGLVAVLVPGVGLEINGARRWIAIGPFALQPSEFAKIALLAVVASLLAARKRAPRTIGELVNPIGILTVITAGLIVIEPDLGSTIAIGIGVFCMLFAIAVPGRLLVLASGVGLAVVALAIYIEPFRRDRMLAFLDPWNAAHVGDESYQVVQGMIGFGSGGLFGRGLGESVQKWSYLPEAHTDMIFAIIGEELGLAGALGVIAAFAALAWAGLRIALSAPDRFQRILVVGIIGQIVGQAAVNLGAVTGLLPLTGIPLPLISFGSSSRLVTLLGLGVVLAVCRESVPARERARERAERRTGQARRRAASHADDERAAVGA